jgi:hypothetical protein
LVEYLNDLLRSVSAFSVLGRLVSIGLKGLWWWVLGIGLEKGIIKTRVRENF